MKKIAIMLATIIFIQLGATSVFADYTDVSGHWALSCLLYTSGAADEL